MPPAGEIAGWGEMARTVLKFGGTSVGDLDRIANVANIVAARAAKGEHMAVIVSAMSGETNKLVALADGAAGKDIARHLYDDEYDVVVASGEQVTAGLQGLEVPLLVAVMGCVVNGPGEAREADLARVSSDAKYRVGEKGVTSFVSGQTSFAQLLCSC